MSDHSDDAGATIHDADVRNGEPDALEGHGDEPRHPDHDATQRVQPDDDIDVTEPTESADGEPIHHASGGDIGEGAD